MRKKISRSERLITFQGLPFDVGMGRPLGVVHLRYQGGVCSLVGWSFGAFSLGGWRPGGGFCFLSTLVSLGVCWRSRA